MPIGYAAIRNYKINIQEVLKTNKNYEKNISTNLTYAIENITTVKNKPVFDNIVEKITQAPESLFKTLTSVLISNYPSNISELQILRKDLKVICRKNPDAMEFINGLKEYLTKTPEVVRFTKSVGKFTENFVDVFFTNKKNKKPLMRKNISNYLSSAEELYNKVRETGLNEHLEKFLAYVAKG